MVFPGSDWIPSRRSAIRKRTITWTDCRPCVEVTRFAEFAEWAG
jgi:hypothetical protein